LLNEHEAFRHVCYDLQEMLDRWEQLGHKARIETKDYALLMRSRETIREHLNVHLVKEEEIFFPRLEKLVPRGRVKFLYLNYDHEYLRIYFTDFCETITDYDTDRIRMHVAIRRIIKTGRLIVFNLLQHILAEDTVYFELAEKGFDEHELETIGQEMLALERRLKEQ
jgi:hemerythrin-like domain-containing protein